MGTTSSNVNKPYNILNTRLDLFYNCLYRSTMVKTGAQRMRECRERQKLEPGKIEEMKQKDRERKKLIRQELILNGGISNLRKYEREKKMVLRKIKKMQHNRNDTLVLSPSALGKATVRVKKALPHSPRKSVEVLGKLVKSLSPTKLSTFLNVTGLGKHKKTDLVQRKRRSDALSVETIRLVKAFFLRDDVSWQCPGRKDTVSVQTENGKTQYQKRLLLVNLSEAFSIFKKEFDDVPVGYSTFKVLRPKHVVPMSLRDQNVCVCIYHGNAELLIGSLRKYVPDLPTTVNEVVAETVCDSNSIHCVDRECNLCGTSNLDAYFEDIKLNDKDISYYKWGMVNGRVVKQEISADIEEAKLELFTQLESLSRHSYNNRRQHNELRKLKENLPTKEIIILEDFAENYLIKHQSEIMQAHWSSPSVTIFTAVVYYKIGYEL